MPNNENSHRPNKNYVKLKVGDPVETGKNALKIKKGPSGIGKKLRDQLNAEIVDPIKLTPEQKRAKERRKRLRARNKIKKSLSEK